MEIGPGSGIMMSDILRVSCYQVLCIDSVPIHWQPKKHPGKFDRGESQPEQEAVRKINEGLAGEDEHVPHL